jgi:hypothetical protein
MKITLELLAPLVDSVFMADTAAGIVPLVLSEVKELPRRGLPEQFRTPLSLVLAGPAELVLSDGNYPLEHAQLGRIEWYLWPISAPLPAKASEIGKQCYQVAFS